ncbi:MAG TPA: isocitrate lyase/phosphoenolpyruvate mutase family protein [Mycobacteriales bacterium]|nr:isocitrate lyase/phosphoenolpyruvate mutase family protein [Mycobacteriales bacterium]
MTAAALRALHVPGNPLLLANVWDAATARMAAAAGHPAVATSSVAVAESLGYEDGHHAPVAEMFAAARRIAAVISVPLTVDAEGGYGLEPGEFVDRLLETGAVGCNLEDTDHAGPDLIDADRQAEWLAAVRSVAGDRLVLNARIDTYLRDVADPLAGAIERAEKYLAAGADCVYPIFIRNADDIGAVTRALAPASVNVNYRPGGPGPAELADLGVARISLGGGIWKHEQARLTEIFTGIGAGRLPY